MDLRESMRDSVKVFSQRSACTTCCETFLPQNFHGIQYVVCNNDTPLYIHTPNCPLPISLPRCNVLLSISHFSSSVDDNDN